MAMHIEVTPVSIFGLGLSNDLLALPSLPTDQLSSLAHENIHSLTALLKLKEDGLVEKLRQPVQPWMVATLNEAHSLQHGEESFNPHAIIRDRAIKTGASNVDIAHHIGVIAEDLPVYIAAARAATPDSNSSEHNFINAYEEYSAHGGFIGRELGCNRTTVWRYSRMLDLPLIGHADLHHIPDKDEFLRLKARCKDCATAMVEVTGLSESWIRRRGAELGTDFTGTYATRAGVVARAILEARRPAA